VFDQFKLISLEILKLLEKWYMLFLIQDPYCVCIIGTEKQQTKHHNESGKNPKWND
jgi:hypothetical protein